VRLSTSTWLLIFLAAAAPAWAALGKTFESVAADRQQMAGELRSSAQNGFAVHEITLGYGEKIKEFAAPNGVVFGVAWSGPVVPDLKRLLGDYFPEFQKAVQAAGTHRRALALQSEHLVVESAGHMRAFHGRAYVPALVPANISAVVVK